MNIFSPITYTSEKVIKRKLGISSTIMVKEGDKVSPSDIIAESKPSAGFHIVNIAITLNVKPLHASKYIIRKEGERIYKGEILAEKQKFLSKDFYRVTSPIDGVIQHINNKNGQILIKMIKKPEKIPAGVWGKITNIINTQNEIEITTQVLEITGKVGRGYERAGTIKIITKNNETIHEHMIKEDHQNKIIIGGGSITREALGKCITVGVSGCVVGGIDYRDILAVNQNSDIGVSFMALEGYGTLTADEKTWNTIKECDNFYAFIDGKNAKLIIPLEKINEEQITYVNTKIEVGTKVRVTFDNDIAKTGIIKEYLDEYTFPSGIRTQAVKITQHNKEIIVPMANIEIIM